MYLKRYKQIKVEQIKNARFTNWFWYIHRATGYIKIDLLKRAYETDPYVKTILFYCYNPEFTLNLTPIRMQSKDKCMQSEYRGSGVPKTYKKFTTILDAFMNGESTRQQTLDALYTLYTQCDRYTRWVYNRVLDRDLLIGADIKQLRKHFPDLFSSFNTENWKPLRNVNLLSYPVLVTEIGGKRVVLVSKDKYYSIKTAQGYDVVIGDAFKIKLPKEVILEGIIEKHESIARAKRKHKYKVIDGKFKRIYIKGKKEVVKNYTFHCFDYVPLSEFEETEKELTLQERVKIMRMLNIEKVKFIPSLIANTPEDLLSYIKEAKHPKILIREMNKKYGEGCYFTYKRKIIDKNTQVML